MLKKIQPFEAGDRLDNMRELRPHRKENTAIDHYKDQLVVV
jgi:hypothetical protein